MDWRPVPTQEHLDSDFACAFCLFLLIQELFIISQPWGEKNFPSAGRRVNLDDGMFTLGEEEEKQGLRRRRGGEEAHTRGSLGLWRRASLPLLYGTGLDYSLCSGLLLTLGISSTLQSRPMESL